MGYEILGHTADVRIKTFGKTVEDLFLSALEGLKEILHLSLKEKKIATRTIALSAPDQTTLLIDFLNEILTDLHAEHFFPIKLNIMSLTKTSLEIDLEEVFCDAIGEDVKAVTYHEANIVKKDNGLFESLIVLDI